MTMLHFLIIVFAIGTIVSVFRREWPMVLYYGGLTICQVGVLLK